MKRIALIAALLFPLVSYAAITRGVSAAYSDGAYVNPVTITLSGNTTNGSAMVGFICTPSDSSPPPANALTDPQGNTYTLIDGYTDGSHGYCADYVATNIVGGFSTLTLTKNVTYWAFGIVVEYKNVPTSAVIDKHFIDHVGFGTQPYTWTGSTTGVLAQADEVVLQFMFNTYGCSDWSGGVGTGFLSLGQGGAYPTNPTVTGWTVFGQEQIVASTAAIAGSATSQPLPAAQTQRLGEVYTITIKGGAGGGGGGGGTSTPTLMEMGVGMAAATPDNIIPLVGITTAVGGLPPFDPNGKPDPVRQYNALVASIDSMKAHGLLLPDKTDDMTLTASKSFASKYLYAYNQFDLLGFRYPLVDTTQMLLSADRTNGVVNWTQVKADIDTVANFGLIQGWVKPGKATIQQLKDFMLDFAHIVDTYNTNLFPGSILVLP